MALCRSARVWLTASVLTVTAASVAVGGQIEGRVGDGMVRLTWMSPPGNGSIATYRIYRRDYGPSQHYGLRATLGADTNIFKDTGLDNGLPYYYKVVPMSADGTEANAVGELTLCPMRAPIWKYISPEPAIAPVDAGIDVAKSVSRPGSVGWGSGLWYVVSRNGPDVIGHADWVSPGRDGLDNPARGVRIDPGEPGQWDADAVGDPDTSGDAIIYSGLSGGTWRIGAAQVNGDRSLSGRHMILDVTPGGWDSQHVRDPVMANGGAIALLYYSGFDGATWRIGLAGQSGDTWVKDPGNSVLSPGKPGEWDSAGVSGAYVVEERFYPPLFTMYYTGTDGVKEQIGYATSADGVHWAKHLANPVLPAGPAGSWCSAGVGHPCGYDYDGQTYLWFEGTDGTETSIGRAVVYRSRAFGRHTAVFGPEWLDTTIEYFNVPAIYDVLEDLLDELFGFGGTDLQAASYYSRTVGWAWNGNPVTFGLGWYAMTDYPSYPRVGSYLPALFVHESGHNHGYYPTTYYGGTLDAVVTDTYGGTEGWLARVWEDYALDQLSADPNRWGLTAEQVAQVTGDANARRNTNLFLVLASEYGWHIWRDFFCACRPGIIPSDVSQAAVSSVQKDTLLVCMLSAACQTDLRSRFRQQPEFANQIDDAFYSTYYPRVAAAMAGEQKSPTSPSNLAAALKSGPRVKLSWTPSTSLDRNHYNVYSNGGSGGVNYSSPFGVALDPLGSSWTSPAIEGGRLYRFALRAVDHWGNEEKNTSAVVSVLVPQSPAPFIRDWLLLGSIPNTDTSTLMTTDYTVTGEAHLDPYPGQIEGTYRWRRASTPSDLEEYMPSFDADRVDLGRLLCNPSLCASYAFTRVFVPNDAVCYLQVSHDDGCYIWLNGTEVYSVGSASSEVPIPVALEAGWNRLCLKVCNYWGGYSFTARFCDVQGGVVPGMVWSVDAPGSAPAARVAGTELAFNDVRIGQSASLVVNVLNRGTATLVVSNIKVQGASASEFQCSSQGLDLAAGAGGQLSVSFTPTTMGAKSAELVASTNDPNLPVLTIRLSGVGRSNAVYVNDDSSSGDVFTTALGNDNNSGLDPASPLRHVSTAIERFALQDGDVIYVDTGLYVESANVFSTDHGFTIRGAGKDLTIIDGGGITPCLVFNAVTRAECEQLTLQNGKGLPFEDGTHGGALFTAGTEILVTDAILRNSEATFGGGAFLDRGDATLRKVVVSGNSAVLGGGVLFEVAGTMQECAVTSNQAMYGAGLYFYGGGKAERCEITANTGGQDGGGVYFWGNGGVLNDSTVSLNRTNYGGGLYFYFGGMAQHCVIQGNTANYQGGGVFYCGSGTLQHGDVGSNRADQGGGLYFAYGGGIAQNCLIHANQAKSTGGGAFLWGCGTVQNGTVIGNSATSSAGGIYCVDGGMVRNTIMYSNRAPKGSNYYNDGQGWSYSYCRATPKVTSGLGNIDADPLFADPGYWDANGTLDALDDDFWVDGDYHLKSQAGRWDPKSGSWVQDTVTSPCIDAGNPSTPVGDEPAPNGGRIDMGMYGGTPEASKSYP